jgi:hypothetical protein
MGFEWDLANTDWEKNFKNLEAFNASHKHCRVPRSNKAYSELLHWVSHQRSNYLKGKISIYRFTRLNALGLEWDPSTLAWERCFTRLEAFNAEHGHCCIPSDYKKDSQLGNWVGTQRIFYFKGKLSSNRIARLEALGFEWDPITSNWEHNFEKLLAFKDEHGDCRVPARWSKDEQLGRWVSVQRIFYSKEKISPDRIARLNAIGFEWDLSAADWEKSLAKLIAFKAEHGDCRVPQRWKVDPKLASWVNLQRNIYNKRKLTTERITRLEAVGFEWNPFASDWEKHFAMLESFKAEHGHCRVTPSFMSYPKLARWVQKQRTNYSTVKLSSERISKLEAVGFEWKVS